MTHIPPYSLWLGHAGEGRDFRRLFEEGIQAVIDLAMEEPPSQPPRELIYLRLPLLDGASNRGEVLSLAINIAATLFKLRLPTLIICSAGESRAPAVAAAALSLLTQDSPEDCLQRLSESHPSDVTPTLWQEVKEVLSAGGKPEK